MCRQYTTPNWIVYLKKEQNIIMQTNALTLHIAVRFVNIMWLSRCIKNKPKWIIPGLGQIS